MKIRSAQGNDGLEEERRLMYVALTRARQRLYVSCAQTRMLHGQTRYCVPSSFLDEIPANLLLKLNKKAAPTPTTSLFGGGYSAEPVAGGLRIGQTVEHAKFGIGVIVSTEGRGADARVQVNFGGSGMKWLALEYAKLTPV
jgi:DNA helicase-2/ATP-dependent DNA helicase PcrA